jgi:hypothetical protein
MLLFFVAVWFLFLVGCVAVMFKLYINGDLQNE